MSVSLKIFIMFNTQLHFDCMADIIQQGRKEGRYIRFTDQRT